MDPLADREAADRRSAREAEQRKLIVAGLAFGLVVEFGYLVFATRPPRDVLGYMIGRDFVNAWMAGRAALEGQLAAYFDPAVYNAALERAFGPLPEHNWSYPPHIALFVWPLALLPYLPAYALWCLTGFAALAAAGFAAGLRGAGLLLLLTAPAVALNLLTGQNGFFTAALLTAGLTLLDRRPLLAGVAVGLLSVKPQLGLLMPLLLALTGRWRVVAAAGATVLALAAATGAVHGVDVWTRYVSVALPVQREVLQRADGIMLAMMPTPFVNMRIAGLSLEAAWTVQGVVSAGAAAAVAWTFAERRDPVLSLALFVTASFLATPYAFAYDMVVFGGVIALLTAREDHTPLDQALAVAVWALPAGALLVGIAGIPGSSLVLLAFAARLLQRLARGSAAPSTLARKGVESRSAEGRLDPVA